jgi:hypothetical protein
LKIWGDGRVMDRARLLPGEWIFCCPQRASLS